MKSFKQFLIESNDHINQWNIIVSKNELLKGGVEILKKITDKGYEALIVGGVVRDLLTKEKEPDDIDITTSMPMEELEKIFKTHDIGDNKKFNIVVVEYKGNNYEIAGYRKDFDYQDGRRPEKIELAKDFKTDSERRDLTVNSLGVDQYGKIFDYHGGVEDIKNKIIRTVGDPHQRFSEDFLRMLRAIRFSARLGFKIDPDTLQAIKDNADKITGIAAERIFKEILGMAKSSSPTFAKAILSLKETGLIEHIFPEIKERLSAVVEPLTHMDSKNPVLNLSVLLHSLTVGEIEKLCSRLKLDNELKQCLIFVSKNMNKMEEMPGMSQRQAMEIIGNKNFDTLLNTYISKGKASILPTIDATIKKIEMLQKKFSGENSVDNIKKVVNGDWIMKITGMKPGEKLGRLINDTLNWIINNDISIDDLKQIEDHIKNENI